MGSGQWAVASDNAVRELAGSVVPTGLVGSCRRSIPSSELLGYCHAVPGGTATETTKHAGSPPSRELVVRVP